MANYKFVESTGLVVPDTSDLLSEVEAEWQSAFGTDLRVTSDTPQGVMIAGETRARSDVVRISAAVANQINPDIAEGVFLDAIWALTAGARKGATRTLVEGVVLAGVAGTLVPAGVIAQSGDSLFESVGNATLDASGTASIALQSVETGPIPCPDGSLTIVVSQVLGWETVNNPAAGTIGQLEESDQAARIRRRRTLALQGRALPEAIVSDLYDLPDVHSLQFRENVASSTQVIDGVTMKPHSIWVCVQGGTDAEIAQSLFESKSIGAGYNGAVSVSVVDQYSGQTYEVLFDRPEPVFVYIRVTVSVPGSVIDPQIAVRDAIMNYVNGLQDQEQGFVVGRSVYPFELSGAVNREYPTITVSNVELSTDGSAWASGVLAVDLWQIAQTNESSIFVIQP